MKQYKINKNGKEYHIFAKDEISAVKKLRDAEFEVGKTYTTKNGNEFTVTAIKEESNGYGKPETYVYYDFTNKTSGNHGSSKSTISFLRNSTKAKVKDYSTNISSRIDELLDTMIKIAGEQVANGKVDKNTIRLMFNNGIKDILANADPKQSYDTQVNSAKSQLEKMLSKIRDSAIQDESTYKLTFHNDKWYYEITNDDGSTKLVGPYSSAQEARVWFAKHRPNDKLQDKSVKDYTASISDDPSHDPIIFIFKTKQGNYDYDSMFTPYNETHEFKSKEDAKSAAISKLMGLGYNPDKFTFKFRDKSVFSPETMASVQEGIEKDYASMRTRLSKMYDFDTPETLQDDRVMWEFWFTPENLKLYKTKYVKEDGKIDYDKDKYTCEYKGRNVGTYSTLAQAQSKMKSLGLVKGDEMVMHGLDSAIKDSIPSNAIGLTIIATEDLGSDIKKGDIVNLRKQGDNWVEMGSNRVFPTYTINKYFGIAKVIRDSAIKDADSDYAIYTLQSDVDKNLTFYIGKKYALKDGMFTWVEYSLEKLNKSPQQLKNELLRNGWHEISNRPVSLSYHEKNQTLSLLNKDSAIKDDDFIQKTRDAEKWEFQVYSALQGLSSAEWIVAKDDKQAIAEYQKRFPEVSPLHIKIKNMRLISRDSAEKLTDATYGNPNKYSIIVYGQWGQEWCGEADTEVEAKKRVAELEAKKTNPYNHYTYKKGRVTEEHLSDSKCNDANFDTVTERKDLVRYSKEWYAWLRSVMEKRNLDYIWVKFTPTKFGKFEKSKLQDVEPNKDESKEDFIARFMSETKEEYPDEKQRYAVANSYWERKDSKEK